MPTKPRDRRDRPGQLLLIDDAERHCVLCGRRLRSDASVQRQYGRRCWKRRSQEPEERSHTPR